VGVNRYAARSSSLWVNSSLRMMITAETGAAVAMSTTKVFLLLFVGSGPQMGRLHAVLGTLKPVIYLEPRRFDPRPIHACG
jgi:hypothetical protein